MALRPRVQVGRKRGFNPMQIRRYRQWVKLMRKRNKEPILKVRSPEEAKQIAREILKDEPRETFIVIALSQRLEVVGYTEIGKGSISQCNFEPLQIFQFLMLTNTRKFMIAHNHLSGDCAPSEQDIKVTEKIKKMSDIMEVNFVDHIIVSEKEEYSFEEDYLPFP